MDIKTIWARVGPTAKIILASVLSGGATLGTTTYLSNKAEVVVPISAARQQLIDTGHVDAEKLRDALNRALDDEFRKAGFCTDPSIAEKDITKTVRRARCVDTAVKPQ